MNVLVTAGNTQTPIDKVRCITNIFTGRTGAQVALAGHRRGHRVTLLTSHPEVIRDLAPGLAPAVGTWAVRPYRTFDDLRDAMERELTGGGYDVLIHAAAVSDYELAGVFVPVPGTAFDTGAGRWTGDATLADAAAGKVKSHHPELWMRLVPTPKLADRVRRPWGFRGTFVKFKLEVGASDGELRAIALKSLAQSEADLIVANTLEGMAEVAFIGDAAGGWQRTDRPDLSGYLWSRLSAVEGLRHPEGLPIISDC
jgi:phosphopantothenate---cysteine ligase (CTP)